MGQKRREKEDEGRGRRDDKGEASLMCNRCCKKQKNWFELFASMLVQITGLNSVDLQGIICVPSTHVAYISATTGYA